MGMDVFRFEVVNMLSSVEIEKYLHGEDDNSEISRLEVNPRTLAWMEQNQIGLEAIHKIKELDWKTWFEKNPQYKNYSFLEWDFSEDTSKNWVQLETPEGKTILIDDGFIYQEVGYVFFKEKEIGYMRKPFRHSETPSRMEGCKLILNVTNFSDEGENALEELKRIDSQQAEDCNVLVFNPEQLDKIKNCSFDPQQFKESFMDNWKTSHYVLFNW